MRAEPAKDLFPIQPDFGLFQTYAESANVIFWAADPQTFQLVYVSPHAERALGVPLDQWLRPSFWHDHLHAVDRDRVLAELATAVADQQTHLFEYRLIASDGASLWFRDRVCLLANAHERLLCGMMTDVTAFKTAVHQGTDTPGYTSIFLEIVTLLSGNAGIGDSLTRLARRLSEVFDVTAVHIMEWNAAIGVISPLAKLCN